mmetsp:Transcript_35642/g.83383  ORF Transcript_35642/g.83383 Transcript_35642/m.83383 type:complete len:356 (+) Transcript_35642:74-1141(+)
MLAAGVSVAQGQANRVGGLLGRLKTTPAAGRASPLELKLQQVTGSQCAAVPREALQEAARLAAESEEALAVALRHIEENLVLPPADWRRIHGALVLLERLLSSGEGDSLECGSPIGSVWYQAKVEDRLEVLESFSHPEDSRVAMLVRRAATAVKVAAKKHFSEEEESESRFESSRRTLHDHAKAVAKQPSLEADEPDAAAGVPRPAGAKKLSVTVVEDESEVTRTPSAVLAEKAEAERAAAEAAKRAARSAAARLDALTERTLPDMREAKMPSTVSFESGGSPRDKGGPQGAGTRRPSLLYRCCSCLWGPRQGGHVRVPTAPPAENSNVAVVTDKPTAVVVGNRRKEEDESFIKR